MNKNCFSKILSGGILNVSDLTSDEKKSLFALMEKYGMSVSTAYLRFFDKGFKSWEIIGVSKIKNDFMASLVKKADATSDTANFYARISALGEGVRFCNYMKSLGMKSQMTVRSRFKSENFDDWEVKGVASIIDEYIEQHELKNA